MQDHISWRELLKDIIQNPLERQRLVNELNINPLTLTRWVNNQSKPRPTALQQLLIALPQYRDELIQSFTREFPNFSVSEDGHATTDQPLSIPSEFYARALTTYLTTPISQRFWTLSTHILQQALGQLDPNHRGMTLMVAQCMPPSHDAKVCSLRERIGRGTPPWPFHLDEEAIFLGVESLAGYAVTSCHPVIVQNLAQPGLYLPVRRGEWEKSAAAYPIMQRNTCAGCLLISSMQPDYFLPSRQTLLQNYAALLALAFEPAEFYPIHALDLRLMPPYHKQRSHSANFRQRVSDIMLEVQRTGKVLGILEAEQLVWQQIEAELLHMPSDMEDEHIAKEPAHRKDRTP